jgi:hypothetical protein
MTTDTPSGTQNFIESIIDFIDENVRGSFNGKNPLVPASIRIRQSPNQRLHLDLWSVLL